MFTYRASETFWKSFYALSSARKQSVREKWLVFRENPFDPQLGTHKINRLSSLHKTTVYGVWIERDLRVVFKITSGNEVQTIDIGTHDVYG